MADSDKMKSYERVSGAMNMSGEQYEVNMLMLLFIRLKFQTESFKLAANLKDAGAFDDIVLSFKDKETKEEQTYFIQIKHKQSKGFIDKRSLFGVKGDFSLLKYFQSYLEIEKKFTNSKNVFVIYTNVPMRSTSLLISETHDLLSTGGKIIRFTEENEEYSAYKQFEAYCNTVQGLANEELSEEEIRNRLIKFAGFAPSRNLLRFLNDKEMFYKEAKNQSENCNFEKWDDFMKNLKLYTEQSSLEDLEMLIKNQLEMFCGTSKMLFELKDGIMSWWRNSNFYLTEKISPFWENILQNHASELMTTVSSRLSPVSCLKFQQTQDVLLIREVTHIICHGNTELCCLRVQQSLSDIKHLLIDRSVLQESLREVLFLWDYFHILILNGNSNEIKTEVIHQISNALHMDRNKKIVFITDNTDSMARKLCELFPSISYTEVFNMGQLTGDSQKTVMNCEVDFQGINVKLGTIVSNPEIVTADVTIELLKKGNKVKVGCELPSVIDIYIPRSFMRQETVCKKIFELTKSACIAFSCITLSELVSLLPENTVVQKFTDVGSVNIKCKYFIIDGISSFKNLCKKYDNVHWLEKKEQSFVWKRSMGGIELIKNNLEQNVGPIQYNSIHEVLKVPEQITLIVAPPGMGKTTEICNIAGIWKKENPSHWVLIVQLIDHIRTISQDAVTAVELLSAAGNLKAEFERSLFEYELDHRGNILIILDGLDEVSPYYSEKMITIIKQIMCTKVCKIFVTSRSIIQDKLEKEFSSLAFSISHLSFENQIEFLEKMWHSSSHSSPELKIFATAVLNAYAKSLNDHSKDLMGIPLQCKMLSMLFEHEAFEYIASGNVCLPAKLDLLSMYNKFVDLKFKVYFEKSKVDFTNFRVSYMLQQMKKIWLKDITLCALVSFLSEDEFALLSNSSELKNKYHDILDSFLQDMDKTGLIHNIVQGRPVFTNRTFVEYFVALWMSENYHQNQKLILNKLFDSNWQTVKAFLDRILCVKFELHTAVLHQDVSIIQHLLTSKNVNVNERDRGGRTALHLAVAPQNSDDHAIQEKILINLLDHMADPNIEDDLCKWRPLKYAERMRSWFAVEILLERGADESDLDLIKYSAYEGEHVTSLLKSSLTGGMHHLLHFILNACDKEGNTLLHYAVDHLSEDIVYLLLKQLTDVNVKNKKMQTPVHLAIEHGKLEIVKLLTHYDANLMAPDCDGNTLLHYAAQNTNVDMLMLLLERGGDINARNKKLQTPVLIAFKHNNIQVVKFLIEHGADLMKCDSDGNTALHYAAEDGDVEIVIYLLGHGIDVNATNHEMKTPAHVAVKHNRTQVLKLLLERGADEMARDDDSNTLLHYAAEHDDMDVLRYLLDIGIDVNVKNKKMRTPAHVAVKYNRMKVVNLLLERGADVMACDSDGNTLLHYATEHYEESDACKIVQFLIKQGINVNFRNNELQSPIYLAVKRDRLQIVKMLLRSGADVYASDSDGNSVLHYAAEHGDESMVVLLIQCGVDINIMNKHMQTSLYLAVKHNRLKIVELLLKHGADVRVCDSEGNSLLHTATEQGNESIVYLLLMFGIEVNIKNKQMQTPIHLAVEHDRLQIVELLLKHGADISCRDVSGMNALAYAVKYNAKHIVDVLER